MSNSDENSTKKKKPIALYVTLGIIGSIFAISVLIAISEIYNAFEPYVK